MKFKYLALAAVAATLPAGMTLAQQTGAPATPPDPTAGQQMAPQTDPAASAPAQSDAVAPATEADVKKGASVVDQKGDAVGTVESVSAEGAVVSTGNARVQLPLNSFGKNDKGLVIGMSKSELEAAAKGG